MKFLVFFLLVIAQLAFGQDEAFLKTRSKSCLAHIENIKALGFNYGWIRVPELRELVGSESKPNLINVFYSIRTNPKTKYPPVLWFNGGPGMAAHTHSAKKVPKTKEEPEKVVPGAVDSRMQDYTMVYPDQRGTGCSDSLPPQTKEGVQKLRHYLSRDIVLDAEALREKLFGAKSKVSIMGQSFGSMILHRYLAVAPQSLISVHAHGYAPLKNPQENALVRVMAHKRSLDLFLETHDEDFNLRKTLSEVKEKLTEENCITKNGRKICGDKMVDYFFIYIGFKKYWPVFAKLVSSWVDKTGQVDLEKVKKSVSNVAFNMLHFDTPGALLNTVMNRYEAYVPDQGVSLKEFYRSLYRLVEIGQGDPNEWLMRDESGLQLASGDVDETGVFDYADSFELKKTDPIRPKDVKASLEKYPNIKFFLYSGELDTFSPPYIYKDMEEVCKGSSNWKYYSFKGLGHGSCFEPKVFKDVRSVFEKAKLY